MPDLSDLSPVILAISEYRNLSDNKGYDVTESSFGLDDKSIYPSINSLGEYFDLQIQSKYIDSLLYDKIFDNLSGSLQQLSDSNKKLISPTLTNLIDTIDSIKNYTVIAKSSLDLTLNSQNDIAIREIIDPQHSFIDKPNITSTKIWLQAISNIRANFYGFIPDYAKLSSQESKILGLGSAYQDPLKWNDTYTFLQGNPQYAEFGPLARVIILPNILVPFQDIQYDSKKNIVEFSGKERKSNEFLSAYGNNSLYQIFNFSFVGNRASDDYKKFLLYFSWIYLLSKLTPDTSSLENLNNNLTNIFDDFTLPNTLFKFAYDKSSDFKKVLTLENDYIQYVPENNKILKPGTAEFFDDAFINPDKFKKLQTKVSETTGLLQFLKSTISDTENLPLLMVNTDKRIAEIVGDPLQGRVPISLKKDRIGVGLYLTKQADVVGKNAEYTVDPISETKQIQYELQALDLFSFCYNQVVVPTGNFFTDGENPPNFLLILGLFDFISKYVKNGDPSPSEALQYLLFVQSQFNSGILTIQGGSNVPVTNLFDNLLTTSDDFKGAWSTAAAGSEYNTGEQNSQAQASGWTGQDALLKACDNIFKSNLLKSFKDLYTEANTMLDTVCIDNRTKVGSIPKDFILFKLFLQQLQYVFTTVSGKFRFPNQNEIDKSESDANPHLGFNGEFITNSNKKFIEDLVINKLQAFIDKFSEIETAINNFDQYVISPATGGLQKVKDYVQPLGISQDTAAMNALFSNGQLSLLRSRLESMYDYTVVYPDSKVQILDNSMIRSTQSKAAIFNMDTHNFGKEEFFDKFDILTVGLPRFFHDLFRSRFKISKSKQSFPIGFQQFNQKKSKQVDVFKIVVLRTDELYPDIKFKPIEFIFDFSILPNNLHYGPKISDVGLSDPENPTLITDPNSPKSALSFSLYKNVLGTQKEEVLNNLAKVLYNHQTSHLLGLYLTNLTGIEMNEHSLYTIDDIKNDKILRTNAIITSVIQQNQKSLKSNLLKASNSLIRGITSLSDPTVINDYALRPRAFDRVYNIPVPKRFELESLPQNPKYSGLIDSIQSSNYLSRSAPSVAQYQVYVQSINDYNK